MLRIGLAGVGFMGWIHWLAYQRVPGVKVVAICSRDETKLAGDWRGIQGNFGPPGTQVDLSGIARYRTLPGMLADRSIDAVDLCLPPDLHCQSAILSLVAGKHVFCEKPIAVRTAEAARMTAAAKAHRRQLLIGHVLPFFTEYAYVLNAARKKTFGKLLGGHFKRVIDDPRWLPDFYDADKVGGPLVDLHIHDAHFIRLLFGMPRAVFSRGRMRGDVVKYCETQFVCDDEAQVVSAASGTIDQPCRSFTHGFEIHFERATLLYDFAVIDGLPRVTMPLTVLPKSGPPLTPLAPGDSPGEGRKRSKTLINPPPDDGLAGFVAELAEVVRCIRRNQPSEILGSTLAADALRLCHAQSRAVKSGKLAKI